MKSIHSFFKHEVCLSCTKYFLWKLWNRPFHLQTLPSNLIPVHVFRQVNNLRNNYTLLGIYWKAYLLLFTSSFYVYPSRIVNKNNVWANSRLWDQYSVGHCRHSSQETTSFLHLRFPVLFVVFTIFISNLL